MLNALYVIILRGKGRFKGETMRLALLSIIFTIFCIHPVIQGNDPLYAESGTSWILYPDGKRYSGGLREGRWHGRGRLVWPDGAEYDGEFMNGAPHGEGLHHYADGRRRRMKHERGKLIEARMLSNDTFLDGARFSEYSYNGTYTGWFRGDRTRGYTPHGRGIMRYLNASVYSGQWEEGRMHGNGEIRWHDGSSYMGGWVRGKRTGNGSYRWANGDRYVGGWRDNRMFGNGVYHYRDGRSVKGYWKEETVRVDECASRL